MGLRATVAFGVVVAIVSCTTPPEAGSPPDPIDLMPLAQPHVTKCTRFPRLEPVCPRSVPVTDAALRARAFRSGPDHFVFYSEWGGPYPGITHKNAPPRFAHLVVHAGNLEQAFPFEWPTELEAVSGRIPPKRSQPMLLDEVIWSGRQGEVVLAPSFPAGGIDGDHVIFRWTDERGEYAISLHAWSPLDHTIHTLEALVTSIPAGGEVQ